MLPNVRALLQGLQLNQQLPHWETLSLSLRLLNTAAAAAAAPHPHPQPHPQPQATNSSRPHAAHATKHPADSTSGGFTSPRSATSTPRARVLDGRAVAAAWSSELQREVQDISRVLHRRPGLAVVLVGNRPDSLIYVSRKQEACKSIGIHCRVLRLPDTVSQPDLQACVAEVSADRAIDGVLVQLPLPPHLDEEAVMEALDPRKDVDGFHPLNMGRMLMRGRAARFVPATPLGVVQLLSRSGVGLAGKTAVVVGDSNIVGTPIAALLRDAGVAMVTTCHRVSLQEWFAQQAASQPHRAAAPGVCLPRLFGPQPPHSTAQHTTAQPLLGGSSSQSHVQPQRPPGSDKAGTDLQLSQPYLPSICRTADILVVAVGSPQFIRASWVKPGAVVVDVGINVEPVPHKQPAAVQPSNISTAASTSSTASGSHSSSSSSSIGCKPQVQLQLVQTDPEGTLGLSSEYSVVGDVAHDEVAAVASVVTPVPGGVGPMTIAAVLHNTLQAAKYTAGLLRW